MRSSREETARNSKKILSVAGRLFRERGLNGVSVAEIMSASDLTYGGFYRHFDSKEALAIEACALVADKTDENWRQARDAAAEEFLEALINHYLPRNTEMQQQQAVSTLP